MPADRRYYAAQSSDVRDEIVVHQFATLTQRNAWVRGRSGTRILPRPQAHRLLRRRDPAVAHIRVLCWEFHR